MFFLHFAFLAWVKQLPLPLPWIIQHWNSFPGPADAFLTFFRAWHSCQVNYICCYVLLAMIAFPSSCIRFVASDSNVVTRGWCSRSRVVRCSPWIFIRIAHVYNACGKVKRSLHSIAVSQSISVTIWAWLNGKHYVDWSSHNRESNDNPFHFDFNCIPTEARRTKSASKCGRWLCCIEWHVFQVLHMHGHAYWFCIFSH